MRELGLAIFLFSHSTVTHAATGVDYPKGAIENKEHGSAIITFDVNLSGRAENCKTVRTSGSSTLDAASCSFTVSRALFKPALDTNGSPTKSTLAATIHWVIADEVQSDNDLPIKPRQTTILYRGDIPETTEHATMLTPLTEGLKYPAHARRYELEGRTSVVVNITDNGAPSRCRVVRTSGHSELDEATCRHMIKNIRYTPAKDAKGNPIPDLDLVTLDWTLKS